MKGHKQRGKNCTAHNSFDIALLRRLLCREASLLLWKPEGQLFMFSIKDFKSGSISRYIHSQKHKLSWKVPIRITEFNSSSSHNYLRLNHITYGIIQMLLEFWQDSFWAHFPGEPVPVTDHPLCKESFPNIPPEFLLMQLHSTLLYLTSVSERGDQHIPIHCPQAQ